MRKYQKKHLPYRPMFRFRKTDRNAEPSDSPTPRHRGIKRSLIFFGLLAALNAAAALVNPWLGILVSFIFGPAYIISGIVLAVYAFTETSTFTGASKAEPCPADADKRKKIRRTFVIVALLLIIAVTVFLILLNSAVAQVDFR